MIPSPLIALGATLGTATGMITLCGVVCCYLHKKKPPPDSEGGTPVTMASVLPPGHAMSVYKCTEPFQPQAEARFPHVISAKQTSPETVNYKEPVLKASKSNEKNVNETEAGALETLSGALVSDPSDSESAEKASSPQHVPKLRYSLGYDRQTAELCVSFLEAVGAMLQGEEDSGSHCYVLGTLNTSHGQTEAQTALIKRTPHTVWEEALLFHLRDEDRAQATLTLTLQHCDRFSRHQVAGDITLSLANVGIPFGTARWVDLKPPEKDADSSGEVLLSMSYLPAANRLILVLIKARNIHSDQKNDLVGKDLYVKVTLRHQKQRLKKKQSKRAKHKINPVWNEMIMFEVPPELLGDVSMEMQMLYQEAPGSPSRVLGSCYLGPERTGSGKSHWQEMMNNPRRQIAMWHHLLP